MMQLVFTSIRYDFKQTPVISSDVVTDYDLAQVLYMHCFNLRSPGRWLHSRPADATGSDWTGGNINDDTRGKETILSDRFVSTRTPNFQLDQSDSDESSIFLSTCLYCYFIATVSYRHYYAFSLLQRPALQKQILHLSHMTRRASR